MSKINLLSQRICLKDLLENVTPDMIQHRINDQELTRYMYRVPYPYTMEDAKMYFKYLNKIKYDETMNELGIFKKDDNNFIGVISLNSIDLNDGNAEIGYWIAKEFRKQGYAKEAAKLVIQYAFEILNLNKIYANLQRENAASLTLLCRLGFQVEGLMRKQVNNKGKLVDRYFCGLLKEDYKGA